VTGGQLVCWASCVVPVVGRGAGRGGCGDRLGGGEACVMQAGPCLVSCYSCCGPVCGTLRWLGATICKCGG
jgi:hypothetical protein